MDKNTGYLRHAVLILILLLAVNKIYGQVGFENPTRAVYIFDMARYIDYGPGFADSSVFKIGLLDNSYDLFYEMGNLKMTRKTIQNKPVQLVLFRSEDKILHTQILYVNKTSGFNLNKIKEKLEGHQTMLITEGYEFRESMINFVVFNGKPRFEANEEMIKKAGMSVNQNFLFSAIKTKEDWENLFVITDADLQVQKETVKQQQLEIERQKAEILRQKALLDSLDKEINHQGKDTPGKAKSS